MTMFMTMSGQVESCSMEVEVTKPIVEVPEKKRRRRSSTSISLSPAKENLKIPTLGTTRKRTKSESKQQLTFWGWSPKQAKFKPKLMDEQGSLTDHPHPESLAIRSKWQPIVSYLRHVWNSGHTFLTHFNFFKLDIN